MNLQIQFPPHKKERTAEGTQHVQQNAVKFGGNSKKLMQHWQKQNIPLSDDNARAWLSVRNLAQRVADLRDNGVIIMADWNEMKTHKTYKLGCQCAAPGRDTTGCWLHDPNKKL